MIQLILHLIGDYITQSHWMAENKIKKSIPCLLHCLIYSLPFLYLGSIKSVSIIFITHFFIDRFRLARYVIFIKNLIGNTSSKWKDCNITGFDINTPPWLAVWLLIIVDNTLHLTINYFALKVK